MFEKESSKRGTFCKRRLIPFFLLIPISFLLLIPGDGEAVTRTEPAIPFQAGEKLTYQLRWAFVPVGVAVLEVHPVETINGVDVLHFSLTARTGGLPKMFFRLRERIDSYVDVGMTRSLFYRKDKQEKTVRTTRIDFDWENNTVQYSKDGEKEPAISLLPGAFDPLSVFYFTRSLEMKPGTSLHRPVTDGKKIVVGSARVLRREKIRAYGRTFDTFLIEPELKNIDGLIEEGRDAPVRIWMTADAHRIPIRIESRLPFGKVSGELISVEGVKGFALKAPDHIRSALQ
jgi:hypothetical protein